MRCQPELSRQLKLETWCSAVKRWNLSVLSRGWTTTRDHRG